MRSGPPPIEPAAAGSAAVAARFTDTHCHLDEFPDAEAALQEATQAGVTRVVAVSQDAASMAAVLDLAARFPDRVLPGMGIHPCTVTRRGAADLGVDLARLAAAAPRAAVIGETGLDHMAATDAAQQAEQDRLLERHLELATAHRKPVNLHSRRCLRQTLEHAVAFHRDTGLGAQMHWFTQSKKLVRICNDEGIHVSVGPMVLYDAQAATVAGEIADDLLLLESDAPVPVRGVAGHPARVRQVAGKLASLRGVTVEHLALRLEANLRAYLGASPADPQSSSARR